MLSRAAGDCVFNLRHLVFIFTGMSRICTLSVLMTRPGICCLHDVPDASKNPSQTYSLLALSTKVLAAFMHIKMLSL